VTRLKHKWGRERARHSRVPNATLQSFPCVLSPLLRLLVRLTCAAPRCGHVVTFRANNLCSRTALRAEESSLRHTSGLFGIGHGISVMSRTHSHRSHRDTSISHSQVL
jgi:hypothetical protein